MNGIPIGLCERELYTETMKILEKEFGNCGPLRRLDNFIKFKRQVNEKHKENAKPKSKLSFDVSKKKSLQNYN